MSLNPLPTTLDLIRCSTGTATCDCPNAGACCESSPEWDERKVTGELCGSCGAEWLKEDNKRWQLGKLQFLVLGSVPDCQNGITSALEALRGYRGDGDCDICGEPCIVTSSVLGKARPCMRFTRFVDNLSPPEETWAHVECK